jgi:pteridine reductase
MSRTRKALVTGASLRIGRAIAERLHSEGCDVMLHYNSSKEQAQALADQLNGSRSGSAVLAQGDLSSASQVDDLIGRAVDWAPALDLLVNNASRFYPTRVGETRAWQWADLVDSNLRGPYFLVQGLLEPLRTAGGSVVNLVDVHAERPMPNHAVYCISKAGLVMMTRALAQELGPAVRVNGVAPGAILWPDSPLDSEHKDDVLSRTSLGRLGDPADIAGAVAYLGLNAPYVTGQVLAVDGGRSLNM